MRNSSSRLPEPPVLGVFGPTASGKSAVADLLAQLIPAEVISADSAQLYRGLPILTNQSPAALVGIWDLDRDASVVEYQRLAHAAVDASIESGRTALVAGGTGLYFRAALGELEVPPAPGPGARARWERLYDERGGEAAHALLDEVDPEAAATVHANDRRRVVRALELAESGSSLRPAEDRLWSRETRHESLVVGLEVPVAELSRRIEARTHGMFDAGVEEEVREALARQLSSTAQKIMGLREVAELPREEAIAALAARTRRFAAYQRKWMRRIPGLVTVRADRSPEEVAHDILALARSRQRVPAGRAD